MPKKTNLIYLAGPISGCKYNDTTEWRSSITNYFLTNTDNIKTLSPMRNHEYLRNNTTIDKILYENIVFSTPKYITTRDLYDIKRCDAVFMNLLSSKTVSIGTMLELGYAKALDKLIIVIMDKNNVHTHAMVNEMATFVVDNLESAKELCISILQY